ncbi:MAG: ABC transporter substrate-binding protein [Erysipelotrichaceae bacterium]|nr:ABC transporter substrate-binding protein [Erysipelotrichaceae bacterium]
MKTAKRVLVAVLALAMTLSLAACGKDNKKTDTPLVVGYSNFSEKFSPFFADSAYDQDVQSMTQVGLLPSDRTGAVLLNAKNGEVVNYNGTDYTYYGLANCKVTENADGTVTYDFDMRDDVTFSDGTKLTADDVLFTMYVLSDPTYDGSSTFWNLPIQGMKEYRAGMDALYNLLLAAGPENTDFTYWTEAEQKAFWETGLKEAGTAFAQSIIDYCLANYAAYGAVDAASSAGLWGFEIPADGTAADFWDAIYEAYGGDVAKASSTEAATAEIYSFFSGEFSKGITTGESADYITGIEKTGDYSLRVTLTEVSAVALYQLGVAVAPAHYYGDGSAVDAAAHKFGFTKGDLSAVKAKTTKPMGAGPYKFVDYKDGIVYFEANDTYYLGAPKTKYLQFKEGSDTDKLDGIVAGTTDVSDPSFNTTTANKIRDYNKNGELNGPVITTSLVDNLGYGYIGICADLMNVGGKDKKDSDQSKALRKAFATIYSVYRELSVGSYYGELASVINYPISNTSWAAPQTTDADYAIAFSKDAKGNDLYADGMTAEERYAAAVQGALTWFEAAGYTVADGKVTAAPEGGRMEFTAWIPGDGTGDHPAFMILEESKKALESIGITLNIKDLSNSSELWDALDAVTVDMWCAAWGSTVDPDMTQVYNSENKSGSNHYHIADAKLDEYMAAALKSSDQAYRKVLYKQCLDIIIDWAVEVPTYQRKNAVVFSSERVNMDTVVKDITPFYGWLAEIEKVELK